MVQRSVKVRFSSQCSFPFSSYVFAHKDKRRRGHWQNENGGDWLQIGIGSILAAYALEVCETLKRCRRQDARAGGGATEVPPRRSLVVRKIYETTLDSELVRRCVPSSPTLNRHDVPKVEIRGRLSPEVLKD